MRYFGGKERISGKLVEFMSQYIENKTAYIEPFVGGCSVIAKVNHENRIGNDINKALIALYKAIQNGWIPPDKLTNETYIRLKTEKNEEDPLTAFAGFGCSFAGKWFGGYARGGGG